MKNQLLLFLCLLGITISQAQTFNEGVLQYTVTDATNNHVSVNKIGTTCPTGRLWIPVTVDFNGITYAVKSIEDNAFSGCSDITEVSMNMGLNHIGNSAFRNCTSLAYFRGSNLVTSIGNHAFENCSSLGRFTIPDGVTSIGMGTFNNCTSLIGIGIPEGITNIGDQAFQNCSSLINVNIPNSVTSIGIGAFSNCSNLNNIVIPNNVTTIGVESFSNCLELKSVDIGKSVTSLGDSTFKNCSALTSVTVHWDTPLVINANVFEDVAIENIPLTIPSDSETAYQAASVWQNFGSYLKYFNDGVLEYTVTDIANSYVSVKKYNDTCPIGDITIPEFVTNNGTTYTIISIEDRAFYECSGLTSVSFPQSLVIFGYGAFAGCTSLTNVIIPNSVKSIGNGTFHGCSSLTSVSFPEDLIEIGGSVFSQCTSLTEISLPESLTSIGSFAFQNCASMTSISIPESVTSIEEYAFSICTGLTSFTIPNSVTSLGDGAFWRSTGLTNFTVHWDIPLAINANVFAEVSIENIVLNVPEGTDIVYQNTPVWQDFGSFREFFNDGVLEYTITDATDNSVSVNKFNNICPTGDFTIPEVVEFKGETYTIVSIEDNAFENCGGLTSMSFPDGQSGTGDRAFNGNSFLRGASSEDGLTSIGASAFRNCSGLTNINIPNSVTSIGNMAFFGCNNLTDVRVNWDTPLSINANVFQNVAIENIPLAVPEGAVSAYQNAPVWRDFGSIVLSITDFAMPTTIRLYPNPASTFLQIELNGSSEFKRAKIYNYLGQLVSEENETRISVSNYSKGLYFAEIETTQGKVTKRFLVE